MQRAGKVPNSYIDFGNIYPHIKTLIHQSTTEFIERKLKQHSLTYRLLVDERCYFIFYVLKGSRWSEDTKHPMQLTQNPLINIYAI